MTKQELIDTFLDTEGITEEDIYNTRHRRITAKNFEKVPPPSSFSDTLSLRGSIPDNDDWSHSEISDLPSTSLYVPQPPPDLRTQNLDDTYVDTQEEKIIDEDVERNRLGVVPAPKIVVKKIDDVYVTNISETVTTFCPTGYSCTGTVVRCSGLKLSTFPKDIPILSRSIAST